VFFKPDGTKMYVIGSTGDDVNEYTLSTAWDVSTATYVQVFSVALQETTPTGVFFKSDGTQMYVVGSDNDAVFQYPLSTAWDISTAVFPGVVVLPSTDASNRDLFFKPDGTKLYTVGATSDSVYEYTLSTAWDVTTATYVRVFSVAAQETVATGVFFKPDGTKMYVTGSNGDDVNEYTLSTAWDISTATYVRVFSISAQDTEPTGLFFRDDGKKMYVLGATNDAVYAYNL
jgi:DNA-binding beta-propeller fold protein YncE